MLATLVPSLISQKVVCDFLLVFELWVGGFASLCFLLFYFLFFLNCVKADARDSDREICKRTVVLLSDSILLLDFVDELLDRDTLDATLSLDIFKLECVLLYCSG